MKSVPKRNAILAYHFVRNYLRNGGPVPDDGVVLKHTEKFPAICRHGLHASRHAFDALQHAPGGTLCLVKVWGNVEEHDDKLVGTKREIVKRIDANPLLMAFARKCALDVIHLWDAPIVVAQYLNTGDEDIRKVARDASIDNLWKDPSSSGVKAARAAAMTTSVAVPAWETARVAAKTAANAAAESRKSDYGAYSVFLSARTQQRGYFQSLVDEAFSGDDL